MSIINDIETLFSDDVDSRLAADKDYIKAEKELHDFIMDNISDENVDEFERLLGILISSVEHISMETGMKIGAEIIAELLK